MVPSYEQILFRMKVDVSGLFVPVREKPNVFESKAFHVFLFSNYELGILIRVHAFLDSPH